MVPIITDVTSGIIERKKRFRSPKKKMKEKFQKFLELLSQKIQEITNEPNAQASHLQARKCAAWIEYRMMFSDKYLSETLIGCNAASLLLSSLILLLAGCDLPIFLSQADYVPQFFVDDPEASDNSIHYVNGHYETSYLKKFKGGRIFQPNDFPRKLKTDNPEELWSYYRSVTLDNMLSLLDSSSSSNLEPFSSNGNMVKNARHYKSMSDAIQRIQELDIHGKSSLESFAKGIKEIIENIIAPIHDVKRVQGSFRQTETNFSSTPHEKLSFHYEEFYEKLAKRISEYQSHDIIETLARIDYDVSVRHHFFQDGSARAAQAIVLLLCAYFKMAVPEIVEGDRKQRFLSGLSVVSIDLDDDAIFQFWYKYYTTLFDLPNEKTEKNFKVEKDCISYQNHALHLIKLERANRNVIEYYVDGDTSYSFPLESDYKRLFTDHVRVISENVDDLTQIPRFYVKLLIESAIEKGHIKLSEQKASFKDGWSVLWEDVIEKDATIYKHGMRLTHEMTLLKKATGYDMKQLVVFKPERMLFHKLIVYLITHYQIPVQVLLQIKSLYVKVKSIQDFIKESDSRFESIRKEYEVYLDQCYFDDPLELNREPLLHKFIEKVRITIRDRIASGKCQLSPSQSRRIMRMLVVDELLRNYFEQKAERVVADCLELIQFHPSSEDELQVARLLGPLSELEYRENDFEREAWEDQLQGSQL